MDSVAGGTKLAAKIRLMVAGWSALTSG